MKAIPEQLRAYFPKAADPARPWWTLHPVMFLTQRQRVGGIEPFTCREDQDRERIDKASPLPPPPILVGQVWAVPRGVGRLHVVTVAATLLSESGDNKVWWSNCQISEDWALVRQHGFLLSCPFGYAPWSGPEVVP